MSESIYDAELSKLIELKTLTWLPWIGENYAGSPSDKKILLIGESHYYVVEDDKKCSEKEVFTREVIKGVIDENHNHPFFLNTMRLLALSKENRAKFWSNIAFYNFIQTSVKKGTHPKSTDFKDGWPPFFELIKVIKPSVCIFLGTTSARFLRGTAKSPKIDSLGNLEVELIGTKRRYKAINCSFVNADNKNIELIFVKHPSQYFSTDVWREYLEEKISPQLEWLKDSVNR